MNERLKILLDLLQMSPSETAVKLSVQRSTFSHLLSGRNKPSFDFIARFLKEFPNVNPDYLILGELPYLRLDNHAPQPLFSNTEPKPKEIAVTKGQQMENKAFEPTQSVREHEDGVDYISKQDAENVPEPQVSQQDHSTIPNQSVTNATVKTTSPSDIVLIVHHYANGTFKAYKPQ